MFTKKELTAYAKAGAVAEEVISSIRTVVAFGGEEIESKRFVNVHNFSNLETFYIFRYDANLIPAKKLGIQKGLTNGLSLGFLQILIFGTYGLAFWYGSTLIFDGELKIGDMLTCFFSVLIGAFSLGGVSS